MFFIVVGVALALAAFVKLVAAPNQLDWLDAAWPGGGNVERAASGVVFDRQHGLKLDVWRPKDGGPHPVIIFFYGGGWAHGERGHYGFAAKALAARGYIVVVPDYRKVPQVRFPAFNQDGAAVLRWAQDHIVEFKGDSAKVAMMGHSAGAYIAVMLALNEDYLKAAGVRAGFIKAGVGLSGPYDFIPFDSKRSIAAMRAWPRPEETQPIHYARADAPPILLLTGTEDDTVKPRNAILLSQRLTKLGAPVAFKAYSGLNHEDVVMALSKPFRAKAPVLDDAVAFLKAQGLN